MGEWIHPRISLSLSLCMCVIKKSTNSDLFGREIDSRYGSLVTHLSNEKSSVGGSSQMRGRLRPTTIRRPYHDSDASIRLWSVAALLLLAGQWSEGEKAANLPSDHNCDVYRRGPEGEGRC